MTLIASSFPLLTPRIPPPQLTGGHWSPTRPAVFLTTKMDGSLDVWDYFYKQKEPTLSIQVTDQPLTALDVMPTTGRILAVGSADGCTTILELCEGEEAILCIRSLCMNQPGVAYPYQ